MAWRTRYQSALATAHARRGLAVPRGIAIALARIALLQAIPQEYAPQEDQGSSTARSTPPRARASSGFMTQADARSRSHLQPYVDDGTIQRASSSVPGWRNNQSGIVIVTLKPWGERKVTTQELMDDPEHASGRRSPTVRVIPFMRSATRRRRRGGGQPVQLVLGGTELRRSSRAGATSSSPGIARTRA